MHVELSPGSQRIVEAALASGEFATPEELVEAALAAWGCRSPLAAAVAVGLAQLDRGERIPLTPGLGDDIKRRGRERRHGSTRP
ncbi:MAG: hypothetical protein IT303_19865 [Dehalococcoidia bacterium]|nr:hypothetical protein [Dehalococcoidia bacterium]